ncbi:MAG TPA: DUF1992 domain-containing protein [Ardenticatenaceae bacterium]|nr:DUF1992 domain-containing protein [Ardenticatenaceae bacterium]
MAKSQEPRKWESLVDRLIDEARERGEFDVKGGTGKRLSDDHADADEGDRAMANKVLKNSGHAPEFIALTQEIDADVKRRLRDPLRSAARRHRRLLAEADRRTGAQGERLRQDAEAGWQKALADAEQRVAEINSKILIFNLKNRIPNMHRYPIQRDTILEEVLAEVAAE